MKLEELKNLAKKGKLKLHKYNCGNFLRTKYIYTDEEDIKIKEIKKVPYKRYFYSARTKDMEKHVAFKITAKDYKELLQDGAIIEN